MVTTTIKTALWLLWLIVFTLLLYLRGFLLTKIEIEKFSSCHDYAREDCWSKPRYKRAVLLLVDALRHDFTLYNSSVKNPEPWQNKMSVFSELRKKFPDRTRHLEFIADPPSATFLRLKGLTTGGLPTFVDLGSNFGASEITEDSWVKQLSLNKKNLVLLGDDTWMNIYSKYFYRAFPYPSFDVWDLHTVDYGVWKHLLPQMRTDDWDVIVAHFLGVDHAGHRYHVNHPALSDKLVQVDSWIREVVREVGEDTVLFVFGDHGMTTSGDHGGETVDEVTSTLFVYSGSKIGVMSAEEAQVYDPARVFQTDLVPTLTMLLGVPTPYSSLGSVIPFLFLDENSQQSRSDLQLVLQTNMNQVFRYIEAYSMVSSEFSSSEISEIKSRVEDLNKQVAELKGGYSFTLVRDMMQIIRKIRDLCSQHWAQFNLPVMALSISVMILLSLSLVMVSSLSVIWWVLLPLIPAIVISYDSLSPWAGVTHFVTVLLTFATIVGVFYAAVRLQVSYLASKVRDFIKSCNENGMSNIWKLMKSVEFLGYSGIVVMFFMSVGFMTNSYILVEDYVTIYFFGTLVLVNYLIKKPKTILSELTVAAVIAGTASRMSATFFGCREEQFWCTKTWWLSLEVSSSIRNYKYVGSVVVFLGTMYGMYKYQKQQGALMKTGLKFVHCTIHSIQCVLVVVYWALSSSSIKVLTEEQICWLPRAVYLLALLAVIIVFCAPSTVSLLDLGTGTPRLYGAMACYSAPSLAVYTTLLPVCALLLQYSAAPVLALLTLQLLATSRLTEGRSVAFKVMICHVIAVQYFYATGHQAAVQQFDWNAAFVGFTSHPYHIVPICMIALRTLMSFVMVGLFLPTIILQSPPPSKTAQEVDLGDPENTAQLRFYIDRDLLSATLQSLQHSSVALILFKCALACAACFIHRRHLMIWNIFTPRMIIEMCFAACSAVFLLFVVLLLERTDSVLRKEFSKISKEK